MSLHAGARLGHYVVAAPLGAGGMGEVYRARDTKLNRDVAIKALPAEFARDSDRMSRLRREAQVLASLSHPNIAAIYGLEEDAGTLALAMELVEGEDLAQRLARGPVPVDDAIAIARQIAEGLEAAHEKGVVHRDLKPANVKVGKDGSVKILDFGLAKAYEGDAADSSAGSAYSDGATVSRPVTEAGVILGTAAYMAPEQARGRPADRRADIWSFGVVLFEMLSGTRLFTGETLSDIVAAVLTREPDWSALPSGTPPTVRRLLQRCLERNPRRRLQAIGEARVLLEDAGAATPDLVAPPVARRRWPWMAATVAGGLALFAAGWQVRPLPRPDGPAVRKVDLSIPELEARRGGMPAISPDGTRMAYVAAGQLHVRRLDRLEAVALPDGTDVLFPFWSPDSRQLAYVRQGRAWKISTEGGPPTELGPVPPDLTGSGGGTWTSDGRIVLAGSDRVGLWEIPASGGTGREVLGLDPEAESDFHEVAALPDGRGVIFPVHRKGHLPDLLVALSGSSRRALVEMPGESLRYPVYSPTGHLLFERETTNPGIWAVPFSLDRLETTGAPFLAVPGGSAPTVSSDGVLSFVRPEDSEVELVRVSRSGAVEPVTVLTGTRASRLAPLPTGIGYRPAAGLRLSPDGRRIALSLGGPPAQLLVYDLERGSLSRVATDVFPARAAWSTGGDRLIYPSSKGARAWNLWSRRADGAGDEERLTTENEVQVALAVSPDGRWMVYMQGAGPETGNLFKKPLDAGGLPQPLFLGRAWGLAAAFSPDGRWLAYESRESGRTEIYARPFPDGDVRVQLSTDGGDTPVWSRNGELLYHNAGSILSVAVTPRGSSLDVSKPVALFQAAAESQLVPTFDATPDGQRFFMLRARGRQHISLIFNWPRDLAQLRQTGDAQ